MPDHCQLVFRHLGPRQKREHEALAGRPGDEIVGRVETTRIRVDIAFVQVPEDREVADHFADEIAGLPTGERDSVATVIDSLCNFESYDIMRNDYDMTIANITSTLTTGIRKALT